MSTLQEPSAPAPRTSSTLTAQAATRSARDTYREAYPLDVALFAEDEIRAIFIVNDDAPGRDLHLVLTNRSQRVVRLNPALRAKRTSEQFHLEMQLRPGALDDQGLLTVSLEHPEWRLWQENNDDGTVSFYFAHLGPVVILPEQRLSLTLHYVKASPRGGSRSTQVALRYQTSDASSVQQRLQHLEVLNQRGFQRIPLRIGFEGSNTVWNDGQTQNELTLHISNASRALPIEFTPAGSEAPTRFVLSFDTGDANDAWALGTANQLHGIEFAARDGSTWKIRPELLGSTPQWILEPTAHARLEPGEQMILELTDVIAGQPSGIAALYVIYENIPGFWDGELDCVVEKGPLVHRLDHVTGKDNVGVRTDDPRDAFAVAGAVAIGASFARGHRAPNDAAKKRGDRKTSLPDDGLVVEGRLGVGTDDPQVSMAVSGNAAIGTTYATKSIADGTALILEGNLGVGTDDPQVSMAISGNAAIGTTYAAKTIADGTALIVEGNLGVGTDKPDAALAVAGDVAIGKSLADKPLRAETRLAVDGGVAIGAAHREARPTPTNGLLVQGNVDLGGDLDVTKEVRAFTVHATGALTAGSIDTDGPIRLGPSPDTGTYLETGLRFVEQISARNKQAWPVSGESEQSDDPDGMPSAPKGVSVKYLRISAEEQGYLSTEPPEDRSSLIDRFSGDRHGFTRRPVDVLTWYRHRAANGPALVTGVHVNGRLTASKTKEFRIAHPSQAGHQLVHACLEGPEAAVYYRGTGQLSEGRATIRLPDYFEALTRHEGRTVTLTAIGREPFLLSYEEVRDGRFTVYGTRAEGRFSWELKAVRADVDLLEVEVPAPDYATVPVDERNFESAFSPSARSR